MSADHPNPIFEYFHGITVKDVIGEKKVNVVTLHTTDSVEKAVKTLSESKILSAPVLNEKNEFIGFVDVLDILKYINKAAPNEWSLKQDELQSLKIAGRAISLVPLSQVVNFSEKDPMMVVQITAPASNLLKIFAHGFHRAAVFDKEVPVNVVSQSDVVRHLQQHLHMGKLKEIGSKKLSELGYASSQIESIPQKSTVLDALKLMNDKSVGQLAVVHEETGRLVGNFSASDLRGLYQEDFPHLLQSIHHYLSKHSPHSLKPICGVAQSTLIDTVKELVDSKLHHLWIIDDFKPVGIISLTDVMKISTSKF